jgi:Flp pilus assembly protein TadG
VIVALIIVVLFGFLGLAVDGGRAYLDRRGLQAAVDAAALAAAYNYMNTTDYSLAE